MNADVLREMEAYCEKGTPPRETIRRWLSALRSPTLPLPDREGPWVNLRDGSLWLCDDTGPKLNDGLYVYQIWPKVQYVTYTLKRFADELRGRWVRCPSPPLHTGDEPGNVTQLSKPREVSKEGGESLESVSPPPAAAAVRIASEETKDAE